MSGDHPIRPAHPVDDLLEAAGGVSGNALSARMGKATSYGNKVRARGDAIQVATLLAVAEALDLEITITARPAGAPSSAFWCAECGNRWNDDPAAPRCPRCGETSDIEPR